MPLPLNKSAAGYMHPKQSLNCKDCFFYITSARRCLVHQVTEEASDNGSCNYFVDEYPDILTGQSIKPFNLITREKSGYQERDYAMNCGTCRYYLAAQQRCKIVKACSQGDDSGYIHAEAGCNLWEDNPTAGLRTVRQGTATKGK